jgi:uncharacterized Fe-S cluster protein YjdI
MDASERSKTYSNDDLTVVWKPTLCCHAGKCVSNLPAVFKPKEKPWVQLENATSDEIRTAVALYPSGALSIQ